MTGDKIPAVFMRGGTSKGVFFKAADLPPDRADRDRIFLQVLGSPDPYGRQLDGLGGGVSSLSKAVIVAPSGHSDADVDYTFVQVAVDRPLADYAQTCGNLSAAVGPFSVEEGLVAVPDGHVTVRVSNTNTGKIYHASFPVREGHPVEVGDFRMPGVSGSGALVRLDYLDPGGARTSGFLPTGAALDRIDLGDGESVEVSLVDATSPVVFVAAKDIGRTGTEMPDELEADAKLMARLDRIRRAGAVAMGLADAPEAAPLSTPKVAMVAGPRAYTASDGTPIAADDHDILVRMVSMERLHRAVTGTGAMCLAAACQVPESLPGRLAATIEPDGDVRIASPAGIATVSAAASRDRDGAWRCNRVTVYRTQRRLMEGRVVLPRG